MTVDNSKLKMDFVLFTFETPLGLRQDIVVRDVSRIYLDDHVLKQSMNYLIVYRYNKIYTYYKLYIVII